MPASVEIKGEIIVITWTGVFRLGDVSESLSAVSDILDKKKYVSILIRDNVQIFHFDAKEARQVAYLLESLQRKGLERTGFVVSKRVHYGIGRMINAYCDMSQVIFEVFWDEESALAWMKTSSGEVPG